MVRRGWRLGVVLVWVVVVAVVVAVVVVLGWAVLGRVWGWEGLLGVRSRCRTGQEDRDMVLT